MKNWDCSCDEILHGYVFFFKIEGHIKQSIDLLGPGVSIRLRCHKSSER